MNIYGNITIAIKILTLIFLAIPLMKVMKKNYRSAFMYQSIAVLILLFDDVIERLIAIIILMMK